MAALMSLTADGSSRAVKSILHLLVILAGKRGLQLDAPE